MTVQDNIQSLIRELEQILWQDRLKDHPEVSVLLEKIRHHLLMGQATLKNNDDFPVERLSEMILHRLDSTLGNTVLPVEVQQLHNQRDALLEEIATLQQQKQAILSNLSQELSIQTTLSSSQENPLNSNFLTTSADQNFQPLLDKLHLYSDSLEAGIERMYRLGQQGESKFLAYLNRLQEKLELFLQEEYTDSKAIMSQGWYLGFAIENNQIEAHLFTFNSSAENFKSYFRPLLRTICRL